MRGKMWQLRILAGTLVLAGLVGGVSAQPAATPQAPAPPAADKPVAVVNGHPISKADFDLVWNQVPKGPVEPPAAYVKTMKMQAIGLLIDEVLRAQFLAQNVPAPTPAEVEKGMAKLVEDLQKEKPPKTLPEFCKESNITEVGLRKELIARLQWDTYANSRISDADLVKYYQENKDFFDNVTVKASHIVIRLPATTTPEDKAKARARLTEVRGQLLAKKLDFAQAARDHSMCPSAQKGGDIGFIPRKGLVEENFARAAFALQPGQISDVVETDFGLHLILVTERKPGQPSDLNKIKDGVRQIYMGELWLSILGQMRRTPGLRLTCPDGERPRNTRKTRKGKEVADKRGSIFHPFRVFRVFRGLSPSAVLPWAGPDCQEVRARYTDSWTADSRLRPPSWMKVSHPQTPLGSPNQAFAPIFESHFASQGERP